MVSVFNLFTLLAALGLNLWHARSVVFLIVFFLLNCSMVSSSPDQQSNL